MNMKKSLALLSTGLLLGAASLVLLKFTAIPDFVLGIEQGAALALLLLGLGGIWKAKKNRATA